MRRIFKYQIPLKHEFTRELHEGASVLCVQVQGENGLPHIWVECDPDRPTKPRHFRLYGTGHLIHEGVGEIRYIGTFMLDDGHFVGHLYEKVPV